MTEGRLTHSDTAVVYSRNLCGLPDSSSYGPPGGLWLEMKEGKMGLKLPALTLSTLSIIH